MAQAADEGGIDIGAAVGGEDDDAVMRFHQLQQVAGVGIGVAVVRILHVGPLGEQRVGFLEDQRRAGRVRARERWR
jgi:hypothetical protein